MSYATLDGPQVAMPATHLVRAACYQDSNLRSLEHAEDRKQPVSMRWVVITDQHGSRRLRMRWRRAARNSGAPTLTELSHSLD